MEPKEVRNENRTRPAEEIIPLLSAEVRQNAYIVGAWIWVEFPKKPKSQTVEELKELGFRWNRTRKVWQHTGGVFRPSSPFDPRFKYGQVPVEEIDNETN